MNTGADSAVPEDWLTHKLQITNAGAALVLGAVRPDGTGSSVRQRQHWHHAHSTGISHGGDVYGANLGIRASAYRSAGGFEPIPEHEDVRLISRGRDYRVDGRTPGGYAGYLREDLLKV